ncbi:dihydroorotate dehydrogenase electron transfer subunit [Melioribacteraceae bacterium 4301-Me]|uniref:dihydroorotate dehydrogenase electron transfer subunit n=1 Tax=Pyranulibacter aquaticus TaxID=3163344 RepID=UPI00359B9FA6
MLIEKARVESITEIENGIYLLKAFSPRIAESARPGQFCNIKVTDTDFPLLRRPFSICEVKNDNVYFMFDIHGEGTRLLSRKIKGDVLDILGPLGKGFNINDNFDTAVVIAGGLGAAPFPFLIDEILHDKKIYCFVGGKSKQNVIKYKMQNISISTDDGSEGFKGNVVDLFISSLEKFSENKIKVFACGPNIMLKALKEFCITKNINCEMSVECAMACGFGICQGCPIEKSNCDGYYLVCKDGPVFNAKDIKL